MQFPELQSEQQNFQTAEGGQRRHFDEREAFARFCETRLKLKIGACLLLLLLVARSQALKIFNRIAR